MLRNLRPLLVAAALAAFALSAHADLATFGYESQLPHNVSNSFVSSTDLIADLRGFIGTTVAASHGGNTGSEVLVRGGTAVGDGLGGLFYWNSLSTASDDGVNVIQPTAESGAGRWLRSPLAGQAGAISPMDPQFGAVCNDSTDDSAAFAAWFADLLASGQPGVLPAATCKINSQVYWNLTTAATRGVTIYGAGKQISKLDLRGVTSGPALLIGGNSGTNLFYSSFRDFGVECNLAATCVQFGHEDFSDPMNVFSLDLWVGNSSTSASAVAAEFNYYLNSPYSDLVANNGGHGDALLLRQAVFDNFFGSFSTADNGVHYTTGYAYGNVFHAIDIENVATLVKSDISFASDETFLGGEFVWSGSPLVMNAASNGFRFEQGQFGSGTPTPTGAKAAVVQIDQLSIGTYNFGAINLNPATGQDADYVALIPTGNVGGTLMQKGTPPNYLPRWFDYTDNTTETGGNAGSNWGLERFNDAGTGIDDPFSCIRATGVCNFADGLTVPTAAPGTNTQEAASTAFVLANSGVSQIQVYSSSGAHTYTPAAGAEAVYVYECGGGGGGGGGAEQASGTGVSGGGGGGGGGCISKHFKVADLGASVTVTVGGGGAAGTAAGASNTAGGNGAAGGDTTFGNLLRASGGGGGAGGQLNASSGGGGAALCGYFGGGGSATGATGGAGAQSVAPNGGTGTAGGGTTGYCAGSGGAGSSSAGVAATGGVTAGGASGGGSGGGVSATPGSNNGGAGGNQLVAANQQGTLGGGGTSGSPNGTSGAITSAYIPGLGGGGGYGNASGAGGTGGAGLQGGGGGGGGSALNGSAPGAGAAGGNGFCFIVEYY